MTLGDWYWGDGNSTLQDNNPVHTYNDPSTPHNVALIVTPKSDVLGIDLIDCGVTFANVTEYLDLQNLMVSNNPLLDSINLFLNDNLQSFTGNFCNIGAIIFPQNPSNLTTLELNGNFILGNIDISDLVSLINYSAEGTNMSFIDVSSNVDLVNINISNNLLSSFEINKLLNDLDLNGKLNGFLDYSNNAGNPTVEASDAYDNLINKGWNLVGKEPPYYRTTEEGDQRVVESLSDDRITEGDILPQLNLLFNGEELLFNGEVIEFNQIQNENGLLFNGQELLFQDEELNL